MLKIILNLKFTLKYKVLLICLFYKIEIMVMKNIRLFVIVGAVAFILLIPGVAMLIDNNDADKGVDWTLLDFLVAGGLLLSIGLLCELVLRKFPKTKHRLLLCGALLLVLLVVWIELAVGIFGSPIAGS